MASRRSIMFTLAFGLAAAGGFDARVSPARADEVLDARHTIEEAAIAVDDLREETKKSHELDNLLADAKGVLIVPSFYKAGFFIGGGYGDGVLLKKISSTEFGDPAFYRMTAGSLGIQFGGQSAEIIFVILTEKGFSSVLNDEFKFGANASIAVASIGAGAEAATTGHVGKDIIAYSKNSGLFMGGALEGAAIKPRKDWNAAVYGVDATDPRLIIQRNGLRAALNLRDTLARNPSGVVQPLPERSSGAEPSGMPDSSGAAPSGPVSSPVQPESQGN